MISVITPTTRPEGIDIIERCLSRQTYKDFEWIVICPKDKHPLIAAKPNILLADPPKKADDFWSLCKAWNLGYATASGELVVNIQDMVWFPPDMLEKFWTHYEQSPNALVTATGDQYDEVDDRGVPKHCVWNDPRKRLDQGTFYPVNFPDMEMVICSIPAQAIYDCGGLDEEYDKGPGCQEKEMCMRLVNLGYEMYIDQTIDYKAIKHGRLTSDWDDKYWGVIAPMFKKHGTEILQGVRNLNVGYVKNKRP